MNAEQAFIEVIESMGMDLEGLSFYSPKQWRDRGESYCLDADLIVVFEEHMLYEMLLEGIVSDLIDELGARGYWFEQGTSWYLGVYKL
jgi:hypothetical protein